ncbi:MAG: sigma-70 family RNA polymerase sigma factor [Acidobacteriaceae bacterium]|nr:sigma-70 family RNA polymerase sigma factor [Acidobacteriaceae bacterium]
MTDARFPAAETDDEELTQFLVAWSTGDESALQQLVPLVYSDLRRIAEKQLRREASCQTLQTTALVNEAYVRLANRRSLNWQNRAHFFAVAAQVMRHILVDVARGRRTERRGGGVAALSLAEELVFSPARASELLALDEALSALAKVDERKSRVVEMRFFGGLGVEEIAEVLKISPETVTREWKRARAWLYYQLGNNGQASSANAGSP